MNATVYRLIVCAAFTATMAAPRAAAVAQSTRQPIFLPVVLRQEMPPSIFGIESADLSNSAQAIGDAGAAWVRINALLWRDVEPTEGARSWSAAANLEDQLATAHQQNLAVILIVRGVPEWARRPDSISGDGQPSQCGPIRDDKLAAFARFMGDAVARYSAPSYGVLHWELWNEPDVDPSWVYPTSVFGCYGDKNDEYLGGGRYAAMLMSVYPAVKSANPAAQVVLGGLLMDCDPENLALACNATEEKRRVGRFFEGVLRGGGGNYFDIANFHSYDRYVNNQPIGTYTNVNWANSQTDGPVLLRKTVWVRSLLARYGFPNKPIMNTETAVICAGRDNPCGVTPNDNIQRANAYYIAQSNASARAAGLVANIHYSFEGWNGTNMVSGTLKLLPYTAFQVVSSRLGKAVYVGPLGAADVGDAGLTGYHFTRDGRRIWLVWSKDGAVHNSVVTGSPRFTTVLGAPATSSIGYEPVFVEWP